MVVDFINGDPDRPLITGRVYNEANMPPWGLPAAATQMGFMSRTKDGNASNANMLRFEDKPGSEQLLVQAERNMDTSVKNEESHTVGSHRTKTVQGNETTTVAQNRTETVKGNESVSIVGDHSQSVEGNRTRNVGANETLNIGGDRAKTVTGKETAGIQRSRIHTVRDDDRLVVEQGNRSAVISQGDDRLVVETGSRHKHIKQNETTLIEQNLSETVQGTHDQRVEQLQRISLSNSREVYVKGTDTRFTEGDVTDSATGKFLLNVNESGILIKDGSVEIMAGGSVITIDVAGVRVNGKKIELNA